MVSDMNPNIVDGVVEKKENGIYYREWQIKNPKAVVLLVHGLSEHCQRYASIWC